MTETSPAFGSGSMAVVQLTQLITAARINAAVCERSLARAVPDVTRARRAAAALAVNMTHAADILLRARAADAQNG